MPTAAVPPLSEMDAAIARWEGGNNQRYFVSVEETVADASRLVRVVVVDGDIRAAQLLEEAPDGWGAPQAMPVEDARVYTVDALLARVRADATGSGPVPFNLRVIFDPIAGFPAIVNAEALATYNEQGQVLLNRAFSYELLVSVESLLEDTFGIGRAPLMTLTKSGGPDARCDNLRIFPDGSSVYTDDCRQALLQLRLPAGQLENLTALGQSFARLEAGREADGEVKQLVLLGEGEGAPDPQTEQKAWELAEDLYNLLSRPVGARLTLVYVQDNQLIGFDVQSQLAQPARLRASGTLFAALINPDGTRLAFSDEGGLHWLDTGIGTSTPVLPPPEDGGYYQLRAWSGQRRLLLARVPAAGEDPALLGWVDLEERIWHELPLPDGAAGYGCDTGAGWDPQGARLVVGGLGYGHPCNLNPGLTRVDLQTDRAGLIVGREIASGLEGGETITGGAHNPAWSPDVAWIAAGLDEPASEPLDFPERLYLVRPDGAELVPVTSNAVGKAGHPVWTSEGMLFYRMAGIGPEDDGMYRYDPVGRTQTRLVPGGDLIPVSVSPDGAYLLYWEGDDLKIWGLRDGYGITVASAPAGERFAVAGWTGGQ